MRAAIYARKSTEEHQATSLELQQGEAMRFCAKEGWSVDPAHFYADSGISRSEFKNRPGLFRMLNAAERKEFDVVVMRDESRFGGDTFRVGGLVQDLVESGVRLFYYFTAEEVLIRDGMQKAMLAFRSAMAEIEREKIAQRTRESLEVRARKGVNVGGRVYGYDNIEVREGDKRVRVEYRINEPQAEVIREIFHRHAAGEGLRTIAHSLNERRIPSPQAGRRGSGSWAPATLFDLLRRERYRGFVIWGLRGSKYRRGTRVEFRREAGDLTRVERTELRIIDDELWNAVVARRARTPGKSRGGRRARHLLSGLARCAECGGPMQANHAKWGSEVQILYQCAWAKNRGAGVCTNKLRRPAGDLEDPLIDAIRSGLTEDMISRTLGEVRRLLDADEPTDNGAATLETELRRVQQEIGRIATAIATTDAAPEALTRALIDRESRARDLRVQLATAHAKRSPLSLRWADLEGEARRRILELRGAFQGNVEVARDALKQILAGPLTCTPVEIDGGHRRYRVSGELAVGRLISTGVSQASPTGCVWVFSNHHAGWPPRSA